MATQQKPVKKLGPIGPEEYQENGSEECATWVTYRSARYCLRAERNIREYGRQAGAWRPR